VNAEKNAFVDINPLIITIDDEIVLSKRMKGIGAG
jgi:hypothetical protein